MLPSIKVTAWTRSVRRVRPHDIDLLALVLVCSIAACSAPGCGEEALRAGARSGARAAHLDHERPHPDPKVAAPGHASREATAAATATQRTPSASTEGSPSEPRLLDPLGLGAVAAAEPPTGRDIANLSSTECMGRLRALDLPIRAARAREAPAVEAPVEPTGPIGGVTVQFEGRRAAHRIMDCRLVLAVYAWAPVLRAAGVDRIRHLSAYRAGAVVRSTGKPSGHSRGLAFDPRFFDREHGEPLDVLEGWQPRQRGADPCAGYPRSKGEQSEAEQSGETGEDEAATRATAEAMEAAPVDARLLRSLVCEAIERELFQVVVTPHHDEPHANHVHLELVAEVDWIWTH